ncbi:hypothetical protein Q604_UNBC07044G0002, partial [human gut metagenome]
MSMTLTIIGASKELRAFPVAVTRSEERR